MTIFGTTGPPSATPRWHWHIADLSGRKYAPPAGEAQLAWRVSEQRNVAGRVRGPSSGDPGPSGQGRATMISPSCHSGSLSSSARMRRKFASVSGRSLFDLYASLLSQLPAVQYSCGSASDR